jgi:hypothetical protein
VFAFPFWDFRWWTIVARHAKFAAETDFMRVSKCWRMNIFVCWKVKTRGYAKLGPCTRVYPKVSGMAARIENCKWYSPLPVGAVISLASQSRDFCRHNPLCCFSPSVYCCKRIFRYRLSPETFGYTLVYMYAYVCVCVCVCTLYASGNFVFFYELTNCMKQSPSWKADHCFAVGQEILPFLWSSKVQ